MNAHETLTRAADRLEKLAFGFGAEEFWQKDIARADLSVGAREWAPVMGPAIAKPLVAVLRDVAESWPAGKRVEWMNDGAKAALELAIKILGGATADEDVEAPALYKPHWLTSDVDAGPKRKTIACHCQIAEDHDGRERTWPEMVPDAACGAVRDETGIKCGKPAGHTDHHKGTGTDEHGEPMASLWSNTEATNV